VDACRHATLKQEEVLELELFLPYFPRFALTLQEDPRNDRDFGFDLAPAPRVAEEAPRLQASVTQLELYDDLLEECSRQ